MCCVVFLVFLTSCSLCSLFARSVPIAGLPTCWLAGGLIACWLAGCCVGRLVGAAHATPDHAP